MSTLPTMPRQPTIPKIMAMSPYRFSAVVGNRMRTSRVVRGILERRQRVPVRRPFLLF